MDPETQSIQVWPRLFCCTLLRSHYWCGKHTVQPSQLLCPHVHARPHHHRFLTRALRQGRLDGNCQSGLCTAYFFAPIFTRKLFPTKQIRNKKIASKLLYFEIGGRPSCSIYISCYGDLRTSQTVYPCLHRISLFLYRCLGHPWGRCSISRLYEWAYQKSCMSTWFEQRAHHLCVNCLQECLPTSLYSGELFLCHGHKFHMIPL